MLGLSLLQLLPLLNCPACLSGDLVSAECGPSASVECASCGRRFETHGSYVDFVLEDQLDETARSERKGRIDLSDPAAIHQAARKDEWGALYTHQAESNIDAVTALAAGRDPGEVICSVGSGAGFELKLLLERLPADLVLSSDISATLPQVVPTTLSGFSGSLGVFSSDFEHCPVARDPSMLGLVYQALHHSEDAHRALAALLKRNFDDLIVVEPVTNWIVELLAKAGLAKRQEYSGVEPDWMSLRRISEIADREGYSMRYRLWWELPPFVTDSKTVRRWPVTGKLAFAITRAASWATSRFGLGSMAAIRLTKT